MADILEFKGAREPGTGSNAVDGEAEIIIFPGIRIERRDFRLSDRITGKAAKAE